MANNTLTDEERLALQQAEANAVNYGTDTSSTEQQTLKGKLKTKKPLKLVLDRRPFI